MSYSGTHAIPPVLLDIGDDPDDPHAVQEDVPRILQLSFVCQISFLKHSSFSINTNSKSKHTVGNHPPHVNIPFRGKSVSTDIVPKKVTGLRPNYYAIFGDNSTTGSYSIVVKV